MFNTTHIQGYPSHSTSTVNIHEHRAATDKSIELAREYEEKAQANLVYRGKLNNNVFNDIAVNVYYDPKAIGYKVFFKFKLNDKTYANNFFVDKIDVDSLGVEHIGKSLSLRIIEHILKQINNEIIKMLMADLEPNFSRIFKESDFI